MNEGRDKINGKKNKWLKCRVKKSNKQKVNNRKITEIRREKKHNTIKSRRRESWSRRWMKEKSKEWKKKGGNIEWNKEWTKEQRIERNIQKKTRITEENKGEYSKNQGDWMQMRIEENKIKTLIKLRAKERTET